MNNHVPLNVSVSRQLAELLHQYCSKHEMKKAHVVRLALKEMLERQDGLTDNAALNRGDIRRGKQ